MSRGWRAAALAIAFGACGLKNDPVAPELVRPNPPAKLSATSVHDGVELHWQRPTTYTGGHRMRDLSGFDIERAPATGDTFVKVDTVTLTDQQRFRQERDLSWIDRNVVADTEYRYRMVAFTTDGSRSTPTPVVQVHFVPPPPSPPKPAK